METTTKKITLATVKSFINKNNGNIYINVTSSFDGMQDCVMPCQDGFIKAQNESGNSENTYGIAGAWFVGQSRDRFEAHDCETFTGFKVSNACGSFVLAVMKEGVTLPIIEPKEEAASEQCSVEVEETTAPNEAPKVDEVFNIAICSGSYTEKYEFSVNPYKLQIVTDIFGYKERLVGIQLHRREKHIIVLTANVDCMAIIMPHDPCVTLEVPSKFIPF